MSKETRNAVIFATILIVFGVALQLLHEYRNDRLVKEIEAIYEDDWANAKSHLSLAIAIRSDRQETALKFTESLIVIDINAVTDRGRKLDDLSDSEALIIKQIKEYWENDCLKKCLEPILEILSDDRFE